MLRCNSCNVNISTKTTKCPLCQSPIQQNGGDAVETYPAFEPMVEKSNTLFKIVSFAAISCIMTLVTINLLTYSGSLWSVIAAAGIVYAWLMSFLTFRKHTHLGLKLVSHAIAIPLLLVVINMFSSGQSTTHSVTWAASYAMPFILIGFILTINLIMIIKTQYLRDYLIYQLALVIIGFVPLLLVLLGAVDPIFPSILTVGFSVLTMLGLFIFTKRKIVSEFGRKFHM